ncbi:putative receptor-like protein kinase At3g47110 [Triticum dicoccoides]|uniref:putative receptor-like protein kinase At3g47110 n=1 Tax=Triticum dicoccoides TaxID=85692 RepID=UPI00189109A6|nr:putative receptor-like protein kinase At3g47110 [Triticum dicoccoides]
MDRSRGSSSEAVSGLKRGRDGSGDAAADLEYEASLRAKLQASRNQSWNSSLGFCNWQGVVCSHRRPMRVVALTLDGTGLVGRLSPAIGNLTFLRMLNLRSNSFHGGIPASLGRLRRLRWLYLDTNSFSGTIPMNLSACISMIKMRLDNNTLGGPIPPELGEKLTSLEVITLRNNSFTGPIPTSLANLSRLQAVSLADNQLVGSIPPGLGSIQSMRYFGLFNNLLNGTFPPSIYNCSLLEAFDVGQNMLSGSIPDDIGSKFPKLRYLGTGGNHFTGTIPSSIPNMSSLVRLSLVQNNFSGYVPPTLGKLGALQEVNLAVNKLEANGNKGWEFITSLANCSQLLRLSLNFNSFGGQLPGSIVNLSTTLHTLSLSDNMISGIIPADIGNLVGLETLGIAVNSIFGVIPEGIGKLENLIELLLYNTSLSGLIPSSLGNLTRLNQLAARNANLEGPIPASLGELKNLFALDLSKNYHVNGSIPKGIFQLISLSWYLDLSYNSLSGPLPNEVGNLGNLNQLSLSGNQLSGMVPDSIHNCIVLEEIFLDNNFFEGSIPRSLTNIQGLSILNLDMNEFSGEVPTEGVFRNITYLAVAGNVNLCGGTPQLHLAPCSIRKNKKKMSKSLVIFIATSGVIMFSLSVILLLWILCKKLKPIQMILARNSIVDDQYERIPYHALLRGTNGFSEVNLLGRGSYGAVYKCVLDNEERTLSVKVFNLSQSRYSKSFEAECEAMRRIRHRCLIKIITSCSSINHQGQEFQALVFEFMPNGNLDSLLHPRCQEPTIDNTLSLVKRLDIAVDIVDAVEYLHNYCQPLVIHCDLKPSNILLAEDMSARVGDFGISKILQENTREGVQTSYSSNGIRGSNFIFYLLFKCGEGSTISTVGDIYSLGILLLEFFTGRSPIEGTFRDSLDLHRFVEDALQDRTFEIADPTMWLHSGQYDNTASIIIEECSFSLFRLGISCSKKQPRDRALTRDAAVEMHAIRDTYVKFTGEHGAEREASTREIQNMVE